MGFFDALYLIVTISDYTELIPLVLFLSFTQSRKEHRWLFYYSSVLFLLYLVADFLSSSGTNNMWVYHLIGLFELIALSFYYHSQVRQSKVLKIIFLVVISFYLVDSVFISGIKAMNSIGRSLSTLFLIGLNMNYYFELYKSESIIKLNLFIPFWYNAALSFYLSFSFFAFLLSNQFLVENYNMYDLFYHGWTFHSIGIIIKNLIMGIALIKLGKR